MARRCELVSSKNNNGKFTNEKVMFLGLLTDIDKMTCIYKDAKEMTLSKDFLEFRDNNCVSIRYFKRNFSSPTFIQALFDQKEMVSVIDSLHTEYFYKDEKKIPMEVCDVKNQFYSKMHSHFYNLLDNNSDLFFNEIYVFKNNNDLKRLAKNYVLLQKNDFKNEEDNRNLQSIKRELDKEFSKYITFRGFVVALKKYENMKKYQQSGSLYTRVGRVNPTPNINNVPKTAINKKQVGSAMIPIEKIVSDDDKEEFLEEHEIEESVGEGNNIKGYVNRERK